MVIDRFADFTVRISGNSCSTNPITILNIDSRRKLLDFINAIEASLGIEAKKNMLPMQPGDVHATWAEMDDFFNSTGYKPNVSVQEGVQRFVEWYKSYYM